MIAALLFLVQVAPASQKPIEVDDLFKKMKAAYKKVKSADMKVVVTIGSPDKHFVMDCTIKYVAPNLIHEVISDARSTAGLNPQKGFTYISDGKNLQTIGRKGHEAIKAFAPASVQDDGAPVYKEALCFWDFDRQWSGDKGGKASGFKYDTSFQTLHGKKWIGLAEITPDNSEVYHYYIDPQTYYIRRSHYFIPGKDDWMLVQECDLKDLKIDSKIDRSIFKIKR